MQLSRFDPRPEDFKHEDVTFELRCLNAARNAIYQAALASGDTDKIVELLIKYGVGKIEGLTDASGAKVKNGNHLWGLLQDVGGDSTGMVIELTTKLIEKNNMSEDTAKNSPPSPEST